MIKNVIFDLSEVLLRGLYGTDEIITKTTHIKVSMSDLDTPELKQFFRGEISLDRIRLWNRNNFCLPFGTIETNLGREPIPLDDAL